MALIVIELPTGIAPVYTVPADSLGVLPLVVYRIVAPWVVVPIVTDCPEAYVPPAREKVGVAVYCGAATVKCHVGEDVLP
jgi:hypothetical protein